MRDKKEEAKERRRKKDHLRYIRQREARLEKQRAYYREHKEECKLSVKLSKYKRYIIERLL